uniref:Hemoglobin anodic subunit alpha n=1 Tax=Gymnothorax unicolor TaxID=296138 RepID=HBAA_GYMUN|nr:RecName: Full=Hemoglobin anodic subunit alpha; AltName: Full=Hemoglobin anodic alpha chain [Gymnothorax unicolor]
SLSTKDKAVVKGFWSKISGKSDEIGTEAVGRMLTVYPQTKAYFSHWPETTPGSAPVKKHGARILGAINDAVNRIDDMAGALGSLSELHANKLCVDPANFKILAHCLMASICLFYPTDFTPEVHLSVDKFLQNLALALADRYR